jgi:hypothetical protein
MLKSRKRFWLKYSKTTALTATPFTYLQMTIQYVVAGGAIQTTGGGHKGYKNKEQMDYLSALPEKIKEQTSK